MTGGSGGVDKGYIMVEAKKAFVEAVIFGEDVPEWVNRRFAEHEGSCLNDPPVPNAQQECWCGCPEGQQVPEGNMSQEANNGRR
jgi:hypothetical protein